ncbi:hypothetical protein PIROE2DRAFT_1479 [Piromyces sp. E2]|nr:hypothetical protein PIROE2DRAFT_1479 [Piromyces sp. E2]|eukprot:OUM70346.1 hypothetical protein PIROE2DRAFT_1479 [Piromyces sp. E2]
MNIGDFFYGKTEKDNAGFTFRIDETAVRLVYHFPKHDDIKLLSPLERNSDNTLSGNIVCGKLGDDAVFRVYNTAGKVIFKIGEECSELGQSTMTFESTDVYLNEDKYTVNNVPLTYAIVITNALGEKFYYPTLKNESTTTTGATEHKPIDHMEWIKWDGTVPAEAVSIKNSNDVTFLVARGKTSYGGYRLGYVTPNNKKTTLVIPEGKSFYIFNDNFEILVGPSDHFYWQKINKNTKLKDGHQIVIGGYDPFGNKIGIAKCNYENMYYFGEINLSKLDYATYMHGATGSESNEYHSYNYEVLMYSDEPVKQLEWKKWDGTFPSDAVYIKNNANGKSYVVGHANYKGGIHCGYVDVASKKLTISYGGKEIICEKDFEILTGSPDLFEWKKIDKSNKSSYHNQIVIGGNESNGVKLGVAKCKSNNNYYLGKVNLNDLNHGSYGLNNREVDCYDFEVLLFKFKDEVPEKPQEVSSVKSMKWIKWDGKIPDGAVYIKDNQNGKTFIVGKVPYNNGIHCGYVDVTTSNMRLFISYNHQAHTITSNFEVLVGPPNRFRWRKMNEKFDFKDNEKFVDGGRESNYEDLGVAKCQYNGNYYFGKINLDYPRNAYFAYDGSEINTGDYEVLTYEY